MNNSTLSVSPSGKIVPLRDKPLVALTDDEICLLEVLSKELRERGYDTVTYECHDVCLAQMPEVWPDLVISDIAAPRINGLDLILAVKRDPLLNSIPIIILSGNIQRLEEAKRCGAFACLAKPYDIQTVYQLVEDALSE